MKNSYEDNFLKNENRYELDPQFILDAIPGLTGDVAIDLGSCMGSFALKYHERFNEIFCFEACYPNFLNSIENLKKEKIINKCRMFNLAASGKTGKIDRIVFNHEESPRSPSLKNDLVKSKSDGHPIMTISLEDILKIVGDRCISYLKVDIEGAEYDLFNSANYSSLSKIQCISMEIHSELGDHEALQANIIRNEFSIFKIEHKTNYNISFIRNDIYDALIKNGAFIEGEHHQYERHRPVVFPKKNSKYKSLAELETLVQGCGFDIS